MVPLVEVGDLEGPGQVYEQSRVFWDESDRILVTNRQSERVIIVFDHSGTFEQSVGRRGVGPGEYQLPWHIERTDDGPYRVFDPATRRVTHLTPDFGLLDTNPLATNSVDYARLTDGTLITTFVSRTPAEHRHPFHLLNADGSKILKSFGGSSESEPATGFSVMRVISPSTAKPTFWSARINRYQLEEWSSDGTLLSTIVRTPDWFPPWDQSVSPLEEPPHPTMAAIQQDSAGLLWVLIHVAAEDWKPLPPARVQGGESYRSNAQDNVVFDTLIEVVDPVSKAVVSSSRMEGYVKGFAGPGIVYSYVEDAIGNPRYRLHRLTLVPQ